MIGSRGWLAGLKRRSDLEVQLPLMRERARVQLEDFTKDPLSARLVPVLKAIRPHVSGTFLDVGFCTGIAYNYLCDIVDYHGIDDWALAAEVAKEFYGDHFEVCDVMQYTKQHDYVFCAQLAPQFEWTWEHFKHVKSLAKKGLIIADKTVTKEMHVGAEIIPGPDVTTAIWRVEGSILGLGIAYRA